MDPKSQEELFRLRKRMNDLLAMNIMTQESFGTYQQTILQIWQEAEKRRQALISQSETLRAQAMAAEAQSHAFSTISSIMFAVVNGFVEAEEKRHREAAEATSRKGEQSAVSASGAAYDLPKPISSPPVVSPTRKTGRLAKKKRRSA